MLRWLSVFVKTDSTTTQLPNHNSLHTYTKEVLMKISKAETKNT